MNNPICYDHVIITHITIAEDCQKKLQIENEGLEMWLYMCSNIKPPSLSLRISLTFQRLFSQLQLTWTTHQKASELNAVGICYFWPFRNCCPSILIQIVISWTDYAYGIEHNFSNQKFWTLFVTFSFQGWELEVRDAITS